MATTIHPLKFFMEFVDRNQLNIIKTSFFDDVLPEHPYAPLPTFDLIEEWVLDFEKVFQSNQAIDYKLYFKDYLANILDKEQSDAIQQLDLLLIEEPDVKRMQVRMSTMLSAIHLYIEKVKGNKEFKRYPVIAETYNNLRDYMLTKEQYTKIPPKPVSAALQTIPTDKIQWLGQLNVLSTLFYHLLKGQDGGEPYIKASVENIKRVLAANFIDREGHDISLETLKTYFTLGKSEKRANEGDRIELPNKKPKK